VGTTVSYCRLLEKQLKKCPPYIRDKALIWIKTVELYSLREVKICPGYHDEPLGQRQGQRSVRLSRGYRLIYTELEKEIHIKLMEANKHAY